MIQVGLLGSFFAFLFPFGYIEFMSDEPQKEEPQVPHDSGHSEMPDFSKSAPSMWDTFAKNRTEKPRDIASEVREEMSGEEDLNTEELTQLNKELMMELYAMVPGKNKEGQAQLNYVTDGNYADSFMFTFDLKRGMKKDTKEIEVVPHQRMAFTYEQRIFHTKKGDFPEMFIDGKGMIWCTVARYILNENGHAEKIIKFHQLGNPLHQGMEQLPQHEFSGENYDSSVEALTHQDYAQLKGYITLQNEGKLEVAQST